MDLDELTQLARRLGASGGAAISASEICIEDNLAKLCQDPQCENYGLSTGCPPHVPGPDGFREFQKNFQQAVVFKIDVPTEILLSSQRREIFQLLHEIAAGVEQAAVEMGYSQSRGFAGGSCKMLFCRDHADCRVLAEGDACRHPGGDVRSAWFRAVAQTDGISQKRVVVARRRHRRIWLSACQQSRCCIMEDVSFAARGSGTPRRI